MLDSGMLTRITALNSIGTVWKSLAPEIAKVDSDGIVKAISDGDAVITAESAQGEKAECLVTVGYRGRNPLLPAPVTAAAAAEEEGIYDRETELTVGLRAAPAEGTVELDWFEFV